MGSDSEFMPIAELPDAASAFRAAAKLLREGFSAYARAAPAASPSVEVVVSREDFEEALSWWRRVAETGDPPGPTAPDSSRIAPGLNDRALSFEVVAVLLVLVAPSMFVSVAVHFGCTERWLSPGDSAAFTAWRLLFHLGVVGLLLYLIGRSGEPAARFGLVRPRWLRDLPLLLTLLGVVAWAAWFFGLSASSDTPLPPDAGTPAQVEWRLGRLGWSVVVVECLMVGFSEELLYRGYVLTRLERLMRSTDASWLMTTILFGLVHLYGGWWNVFHAAFLGAAFGLVFCVTRRLWPVAIAHAVNNFLVHAL